MTTAPRPPLPQPEFLPTTRAEMDRLGWEALDVLLVSGDAYVDHPSFGIPLLGRWLVAHGYRTGVAAQPRWEDGTADLERMGRPRLFAGVAAGAVDSMLAHYTAFRKLRRDDAYTPGGRHGARPNRATIVYAGLVRRAFPGLPVAAGGIEASLRRASHYDFWEDKLRRSMVLDAKLDVLLYGMGETSIVELARRLDARAAAAGATAASAAAAGSFAPPVAPESFGSPGPSPRRDRDRIPPATWAFPGAAFAVTPPRAEAGGNAPHASGAGRGSKTSDGSGRAEGAGESDGFGPPPEWMRAFLPEGARLAWLPSHEDILARPAALMAATLATERHVHSGQAEGAAGRALWLAQRSGDRTVVFAPPAAPLATETLDAVYALPFARRAHPSYREPVPALAMVKDSVTSHRGCGGGCAFCGLSLHQGRRVRSRSVASVVAEVLSMARQPDWRGSVSDIGGPSANMWGASCDLPPDKPCRRRSCLWPRICERFRVPAKAAVEWLRRVKALPGVRHVRVASGVRHDLALAHPEYLDALAAEFTGGQLKIAPEHIDPDTLERMRKPGPASFEAFLERFARASKAAGKEQYVVPYLMSAFPGTTEAQMRRLADWLASRGWRPQQVQCFIPTPGTVATAMYHAGVDEAGRPLPVARTDAERLRQHAFLSPGKDG